MEYGFNKQKRRLRCMGHVINLVARSLLFGEDPDGFEEDNQTPKELLEDMKLWRKLGPVGKLHNCVVWINRSSQRLEEFERRQCVYQPDVKPLGLIESNDTRWNSNKSEIERAVHLRNPIDDILQKEVNEWNKYWAKITKNSTQEPPERRRTKPSIVDDYLDDEDWDVITYYLEILNPLEEATMRLQGRSKDGRFDVIHHDFHLIRPCRQAGLPMGGTTNYGVAP